MILRPFILWIKKHTPQASIDQRWLRLLTRMRFWPKGTPALTKIKQTAIFLAALAICCLTFFYLYYLAIELLFPIKQPSGHSFYTPALSVLTISFC